MTGVSVEHVQGGISRRKGRDPGYLAPTGPVTPVTPTDPLVALRTLAAQAGTRPVRFGVTGSSTAINGGAEPWTEAVFPKVMRMFQAAYPSGLGTESQMTNTAATPHATFPLPLTTSRGIHFYNAGLSGARMDTMLPADARTRMAALGLDHIFTEAGSNDVKSGITRAVYQANAQNFADWAIANGMTVTFIHQFERMDLATGPAGLFTSYWAALQAVQATNPSKISLINTEPDWRARGVGMGLTDPHDYLRPDLVHLYNSGHDVYARLVGSKLGIPGVTAPVIPATPETPVTPPSNINVANYDPLVFTPNGTTEAAIKAAGETVLQAMIADGMTIPARLQLVGWRWGTNVDPYTLQQQLTANQVAVVPEETNGFRIAVREISSTRVGTYLEGARLPAGLLGLGPDSTVGFASDFAQRPRTGGTAGANDAMLKLWSPNSMLANVSFQGARVGGLQYDCVKIINCEGTIVWRVKFKEWVGYNNAQPDETFAMTVQGADGTARTHIRRVHADGSNDAGLKQGTGGIHYVSTKNHLTEQFLIRMVRGHGMAHYIELGDTITRDGYIIEPGGAPYQVEPSFTGNTKQGNVAGSALNYEASGGGTKLVQRVHLIMHPAVTGHTRAGLSALRPSAPGGNGYTWGAEAAADYIVRLEDCVVDSPLKVAAATADVAGAVYNGSGILKMDHNMQFVNLRDEAGGVATRTT